MSRLPAYVPRTAKAALLSPTKSDEEFAEDLILLKTVLRYERESGEFYWKIPTGGRGERGGIAGYISTKGYRRVTVYKNVLLGHVLAWAFEYGHLPPGMIDHANGCRADNRIENLRVVESRVNSENQRRARVNSRTGLLGVRFLKNRRRFGASIQVRGSQIWLGMHDTPEQAHAAYVEAKRRLHEGNTL